MCYQIIVQCATRSLHICYQIRFWLIVSMAPPLIKCTSNRVYSYWYRKELTNLFTPSEKHLNTEMDYDMQLRENLVKTRLSWDVLLLSKAYVLNTFTKYRGGLVCGILEVEVDTRRILLKWLRESPAQWKPCRHNSGEGGHTYLELCEVGQEQLRLIELWENL